MARTCSQITMLGYLSNPIVTLYTLLWLSSLTESSDSNFYTNNCTYLESFIDCSGLKLTNVPNDLPSWTKVLKLNKNELTDMPYFLQASNVSQLMLGHNHITSISKASLENMPNIEILEMNNNDISKITANDFPNLYKLQNLNLNHNSITKIENGSFIGLGNLADLKLNRNKLSELSDNMFKDLSSLKTLELNKNQFSKIGWLSFQGLDTLLILKLRQNTIDDLADGAFYKLWNLRELHLDHNKLTKVDKGWLYNMNSLSYLNVSNNKIQFLNNGWESCPHLKELDISNNQLDSITRSTFEHLTILELLKLDNNRITFIEDGAFDSLSSLQILDLSYNHISWIVENPHGAFARLQELTNLLLAGNDIFHISKDAFTGLDNVIQIDLSNNTIASIEDNPFKNLHKLKELLINSSSLICDCSLKWLSSWLIDYSVQIKSGNLSCVHPANLKKKPVRSIPSKDFVCVSNDHPLPRITIQPEDATSNAGSNLTLRCGANSSLDSDMTFVWKFNHRRLENIPSKRYESAQNQGVTQFSDLLLSSITVDHSGIYQCIVSNAYGVAYSRQSRLTVFVFPTFTKTPANVVSRVGTIAKLPCAATGFPTPEIVWRKDEPGTSMPAATERRMQIMSADEPYFIVNVKLIDAGVYTCTANNSAGVITANATLTVLEPPMFSKIMKNKETMTGDAVVLECMAGGSPKPKITWTKDGKPISLTKRHYLAADDQLLFIMDTILADMGVYECELSNTLGSVKGRSKLTVLSVSEHYNAAKEAQTMKEINNEVVIGIVITTFVLSIVITSAFWVIVIYLTRKNRRTIRTPMSPIDSKSENSSHSSKDSGTGDSTKRSYQDLLLTTGNANHSSIMHGSHSESPSPVPESTLPLLTTFHPISIDSSPYVKDGTCTKSKHSHASSLTPVHYQNKPLDHSQGIFCASPASSNGVQCACLTATFKKKAEMCDCFSNSSPVKHNCVVNHCNTMTSEHDAVSCYGDIGKRPCSIPVPFHTTHSVSANCCRHHPNSYLCLYVPPGQHSVPQ